MKKRKSIAHWWSVLADNYGWLWKNNLLYLLCIAPGAVLGFLFFAFHAYLFGLLALVFLVTAGPAVLAMQKTAADAALEVPTALRQRFFRLYRTYLARGLLLGGILAAAIVLIGLPVCFALSIHSPMLMLTVFVCCVSLLLWCSCSSQLLFQVCSWEKPDRAMLLREVFRPGGVCTVFGLTKLLWVVACIFTPAFAITPALLGVPAIIRFSVLYYLYSQGDTNE